MPLIVTGVPVALRKFAAIGAVSDVAARAAAAQLAADIAMLARHYAPVGETGDLRDSIEARPDRVVVGVKYAGFVEYGTSENEAQPYLRPAVDEVDKSGTLKAMIAHMRTAI